jgi:transposase
MVERRVPEPRPAATDVTCGDAEFGTPFQNVSTSNGTRQNPGSQGGQPTGFDSEHYKKRNTVEHAINRLKGFRAVATRYEKRAYIYIGTVTLAALMIWLRT